MLRYRKDERFPFLNNLAFFVLGLTETGAKNISVSKTRGGNSRLMSCIHCVYVQSQRRGIVPKSFWSSIGYSFPYIFNRLRFVAQERGSGNGHVA